MLKCSRLFPLLFAGIGSARSTAANAAACHARLPLDFTIDADSSLPSEPQCTEMTVIKPVKGPFQTMLALTRRAIFAASVSDAGLARNVAGDRYARGNILARRPAWPGATRSGFRADSLSVFAGSVT